MLMETVAIFQRPLAIVIGLPIILVGVQRPNTVSIVTLIVCMAAVEIALIEHLNLLSKSPASSRRKLKIHINTSRLHRHRGP